MHIKSSKALLVFLVSFASILSKTLYAQHLQHRVNFDTTSSSICLSSPLEIEITHPGAVNPKILVYFNTVLIAETRNLNLVVSQDKFASESGGIIAYYVEATVSGVTHTKFSTKNLDPVPIGVLEPNRILCPGQTIRISNVITSTGPNFSFLWNTGETTTSILVTSPGIYVLTVTNNSVLNCYGVTTVQVAGVPKPTPSAPIRQVRCSETPLQIQASHVETVGPYTYTWQPIGFTNGDNQLAPLYTSLIPQNLKLVVRDANGCPDSVTVEFRINPPISGGIPFSDTIVCKYNTVTLNSTVTGGTPLPGSGSYQFDWSPALGISNAQAQNPVVTPLEINGIKYQLTIRDSNNCVVRDSVTVKLHQLGIEIRNRGAQDTICTNDNLGLRAITSFGQAPFSYSWRPSAAFLEVNGDSARTFALSSNMTLTVEVTDRLGCKESDSLRVILEPLPLPIISNPNLNICTNSRLSLNVAPTVSGVYAYSWAPSEGVSNTTIAAPNFIPRAAGTITTYTVTVTSLNNLRRCRGTGSVTLRSVEPTSVQAAFENPDADKLIGTPIGFVTVPQPGLIYTWSATGINEVVSGSPAAAFTFQDVGTYKVYLSALNNFGCESKDSLTFRVVRFSSGIFYIPNVFSPAAKDPENQVFKFYAEEGEISEEGFLLRIYNVNGDIVFESTSLEEMRNRGWDGGKYSAGVYTWVLQGKFINEKDLKTGGKLYGSVTLLR